MSIYIPPEDLETLTMVPHRPRERPIERAWRRRLVDRVRGGAAAEEQRAVAQHVRSRGRSHHRGLLMDDICAITHFTDAHYYILYTRRRSSRVHGHADCAVLEQYSVEFRVG